MLTKDPSKRPSAKDLVKHPWFRREDSFAEISYLKGVGEKMVNFKSDHIFQNAIRLYLVNFCDMKQERQQLLDAFRRIDRNNDGRISKSELEIFINKYCPQHANKDVE